MHVTIICMQTRPNVVHLENIRCAECVCVSVRCAMRDAVAFQESAANPNRSHFSSFHVFEIYSCNSYSSYYEKHLAYSTFIFLFCYYKQFFFSLVLSIVLIFIWSSVCVCVAKWHSIPLVKDWTSDKVESEARSRDFKWRWNTATMATARANSNFWVDSFIW